MSLLMFFHKKHCSKTSYSVLVLKEGEHYSVVSSQLIIAGVYACDVAGAVSTRRRALRGAKIPEIVQWLETIKRTGWVRKDVKNPESIADHMYRMGLMALIASDVPGVDRNKCIKMAIVHDIAEAIVGDITPLDGVSKAEKSQREQTALDDMCKVLGGGSTAKEITELWMEYESNSSLEAKFVKDLDKVEMILQALEYEDEQGKDLDEFFQSTAGKFQTETGKAWASEIVSRRKNKFSSMDLPDNAKG